MSSPKISEVDIRFLQEMTNFTWDASRSEIYDFEFLAVPGQLAEWNIRWCYKSENHFSKVFNKIRKPNVFGIYYFSDEPGHHTSPSPNIAQGYKVEVPSNYDGEFNRDSGPYALYKEDVSDFFDELREYFSLEKNISINWSQS